MDNYEQLVKALRLCQFGECGCGKCYYKELKGDWCTEDNHPEFFDCDDKLKLDAAAAIEALEAEVKRLKEANDELREAQTYIDHYGDRWMTSAKDVPTAAYEHGYADGRDEAEAQLPKRGEWIGREVIHDRADAKITDWQQAKCSVCKKWHTTPYLYSFDDYNFCPNCGAKMEVQE